MNPSGFDGVVVSDWAAVHDRPRALAAGLDLEMPGPRPRRVQSVIDAVHGGVLDATIVDEAVLRILRVITRSASTPKGEPFDPVAHHALARRVAASGMVLLKNDGLLPLSPGGSLAVIGLAAKEPRIQGGGSSQITPTKVDSPIREIVRLAGGAIVTYADGYDDGDAPRPDLIADAVADASMSDTAIIYVGLPVAKESEGGDRPDMDLTDHQVELIRAVSNAQPRTVVVLFNGSAVSLAPWIGGAAAVLEAWLSGQAAGGAIADILFGVVNPSGRLAETFPIRIEDTPAFLNFPGDGDSVLYGEGMFIGYRWYEARRLEVMFPFGHGLSYTSFDYGKARTSAATFEAAHGVTVLVEITNAGPRLGSEVVQFYVRDIEASVQRPEKELRGFAKVNLEVGETRTIEVHLDARAFAFWDPRTHRWVTEAGDYEVLIGSSSADIRSSIAVTLVATGEFPSTLTDMSPLQDWLADPAGRIEALGLLRTLAPVIGGVFGDVVDHPDDLDPHFHSYFSPMPIRALLEFAAPAGGPEPEEQLRELMGSLKTDGRWSNVSESSSLVHDRDERRELEPST